jgi:selenocysteine lyase/cysteine desulfurase
MLTHPVSTAEAFFAELRAREFARLDANDIAYLDHAGSALYGESQITAHGAMLARGVFGNPHSDHTASKRSTSAIDAARRLVLRALDAGDDYLVCFTSNASAAIKLVAEAYPFRRDVSCVLTTDNHNSVNGIREYARRANADVEYLPLRRDLRLDHPEARLSAIAPGLFAFPAQSNFSGVHHPLSLVATAQSLGFHVLLDAAAFAPAHPISLRTCPADFVALSFYKMFGFPTGVGALVARRDALRVLDRPWFAGGTIAYASVQLRRHQLQALEAGFEDGTPNFLDIAALEAGFAFRDRIGPARQTEHIMSLTAELLDGLGRLRHRSGTNLVRLYGPPDVDRRGGTVAFNVIDKDAEDRCVPYGSVVDRANAAGVHWRGGCFCNPGAAETAFQFDARRMSDCLDSLGDEFSIPGLQRCMGRGVAVGAVRASVGIASNRRDIQRALEVVASFGR